MTEVSSSKSSKVAVELKFPFSEQDAVEFELAVDLEGGAGRHSGRPWISRQVALTRR